MMDCKFKHKYPQCIGPHSSLACPKAQPQHGALEMQGGSRAGGLVPVLTAQLMKEPSPIRLGVPVAWLRRYPNQAKRPMASLLGGRSILSPGDGAGGMGEDC